MEEEAEEQGEEEKEETGGGTRLSETGRSGGGGGRTSSWVLLQRAMPTVGGGLTTIGLGEEDRQADLNNAVASPHEVTEEDKEVEENTGAGHVRLLPEERGDEENREGEDFEVQPTSESEKHEGKEYEDTNLLGHPFRNVCLETSESEEIFRTLILFGGKEEEPSPSPVLLPSVVLPLPSPSSCAAGPSRPPERFSPTLSQTWKTTTCKHADQHVRRQMMNPQTERCLTFRRDGDHFQGLEHELFSHQA